jgi:hypothetical protein
MADGHGNGLPGIGTELDLKGGGASFDDIQRAAIRYDLKGGNGAVVVELGCRDGRRRDIFSRESEYGLAVGVVAVFGGNHGDGLPLVVISS